MRILIVKLSSIGDVIHTIPVLFPLKVRFPEAHVTWLVEEEAAELIADHPLVNEVLVFRKGRWIQGVRDFGKWFQTLGEVVVFLRELRSRSYDVVIDFQGLLKSGILTGATRGTQKLGFYPGREWSHIFLNEKIPFPEKLSLHAVDRYLRLIESLGCSPKSPQFLIPVRQVHREKVGEFLQQQRVDADTPLVILHPGSRWKSKLWEEEKWAALGDRLIHEDGAAVIFTGSSEDGTLIARIINRMTFPVTNTAGRWGLKELAFLQKQADVVVTPDSGPMHLAAAVGTPVVALFGPTDPCLTGPYSIDSLDAAHTVVTSDVDCRPCLKRKCPTRKCMTDITVEEVREKTVPYLPLRSANLKRLSR